MILYAQFATQRKFIFFEPCFYCPVSVSYIRNVSRFVFLIPSSHVFAPVVSSLFRVFVWHDFLHLLCCFNYIAVRETVFRANTKAAGVLCKTPAALVFVANKCDNGHGMYRLLNPYQSCLSQYINLVTGLVVHHSRFARLMR